ncbi:RHS repeat-associated core domain-containing protein [bacterium]|nr:RHS repeat-associated core domain-containing protein [bacterium]
MWVNEAHFHQSNGSTWTPSDPQTLLYDGHGSTRALMQGAGASAGIASGQIFDYDAYGQMLPRYSSSSPTSEIAQAPGTTLLYAGEQTDPSTGLQYLRSRYYSPASGRFTQMDPFAGVQGDPQSLHKYLYAHANPVMNVDPSGESIAGLAERVIGAYSFGLFAAADAFAGGQYDQIVGAYQGGLIIGFLAGPAIGRALAAGGTIGTATATGLVGLGAYGAYESFANGRYAQGLFRGASALAFAGLYTGQQVAASLERGLAELNPLEWFAGGGLPSGYGGGRGITVLVASMDRFPTAYLDRHQFWTNGNYRLLREAQEVHETGDLASGKSQFFDSIDSKQATLDAAMYADRYNSWDARGKAKVEMSTFIGISARTGKPTNIINVYRRAGKSIHGSPGN